MAGNIQRVLAAIPAGAVPADFHGEVMEWLIRNWHSFSGGGDTSMEARKLGRGIEDLGWNAPFLSFRIERHGATVNGSSRAEMQRWEINTDLHTATVSSAGYRQLTAPDARLDVKSLAKEIASAILKGIPDPRLTWKSADDVGMQIAKIIPTTNQQTTTARRRRFRTALAPLLKAGGWEMVTHASVRRIGAGD